MIRSDLLQSKSRHMSAEYQREVVSLGRAKTRDEHAREKVRERGERFWRAIAHASTTTKASRGGGHAMALSRAMQAHHDLSKAKGESRKISGEVQRQIARVIKAKCVLSAVERVRAKERTVRAYKIAERQEEEVLEVALSRRVSIAGRRVEQSIHDSFQDEKKAGEMSNKESFPAVDSHMCATLSSEICPHDARETRDVRPEPLAVSVYGVQSEEGRGGAALRMQLAQPGGALSCRLETTVSGRVGIVMEAESPSLVSALERERYGMMRRLSESGITIGGFEIRRELTTRWALSGFLRRARQPREDDDENLIS